MIHILNGDALKDYFNYHEIELEGDKYVFREALIEGPVQVDEKLSNFIQIRANYLNNTYQENVERVQQMYQQIMNAAINEKREIVLWFEYDVFCHLNFCFNVYSLAPLLQSSKKVKLSWVAPTKKHPYSFALHQPVDLLDQFIHRKVLSSENKIVFSALWSAFAKADFQGMRGLIHKATQIDPLLKKTVEAIPEAFLKEGEPKMTRPERSIRSIISELGAKASFSSVFSSFSEKETVYGFGDLQIKQLYDKIIHES